jgi:hypothetical protein
MQQGQAAGAKVNQVGIVMATSPLQQFGAANADTPYAITTLDLKAAGPMVVELPPGPFIGFVDDHNMRWVLDMGTIGPERGKGGKHLVLPPDYTGAMPEGYYASRSETWKVVVFVRTMLVDGDVAKALQAVNGIKVYPLTKAGQPDTHHFIDVSSKTMPLPLLTWEDNMDYWRQLHAVIQTETTPDEFRPMFGMLEQLGIANGKPFNPDPRAQRILEEAARSALEVLSRQVAIRPASPGRIALGSGFRCNSSMRRRETSVLRPTSTSKRATPITSWATAFRRRSANRSSARARFTGSLSAMELAHISTAARPISSSSPVQCPLNYFGQRPFTTWIRAV